MAGPQEDGGVGTSSTPFPLAPSQRGLYLAQQLSPHVPYTIAQYVEMRGELDLEALTAAADRGSREIQSPALVLVDRDGEPHQMVDYTIEDALRYHDLRACDDPVAEAHRHMVERYSRPLDLYRDRLISAEVLHVGEDHYFWASFVHHLVLDGHGAMTLMNRVAELYTHAVRSIEPPISRAEDLRRLYDAEDAYRMSSRFETDRAYWSKRVADRPEPARLSDRAGDICLPNRLVRHEMSPRLVAQIEGAAERWESAGVPIVAAAFAAYLSRMTGRTEVVLSLPVAVRTTAKAKRSGGTLANVVPLRVHVDPRIEPAELVRRLQIEMTGALRHQHYRYEDMYRDATGVNAGRPGFGPIVNIMLFHREIVLGDVVGEYNVLTTGPVEDLAVCIYPGVAAQNLRIDFEANPARYDADELERHHERFLSYLAAFTTVEVGVGVSELPILTDGERAAVSKVTTIVRARARRLPDLLDATLEARDEQVPRDLDAWSNRLARRLAGLGIGTEDRVAVLLPYSEERTVATWAVIRSGAVLVPVDPTMTDEGRAHILADVQAEAAIAADSCSVPAGVRWIDVADSRGDGRALTDADRIRPVHVDNAACLTYVPTPFGTRAGLVITHFGMSNLSQAQKMSTGTPTSERATDGNLGEAVPTVFDGGVPFRDPREVLTWSTAPASPIASLVLDRGLRPVPFGGVGDVYLLAPASRGFEGRPGWTASVLVASPYGPPGGRMYRLGETARWTSQLRPEVLQDEDDAQSDVGERRRALADIESAAPLFTDRLRAVTTRGASGTVGATIPDEVHTALRVLARRQRVTMFVVVHAALALVVARLSRVDDVVMGVPTGACDGGDRIANVVPLRIAVDGTGSFRDLVLQAKNADAAAFDAAGVPFADLADLFGGRCPQIGLTASYWSASPAAGEFGLFVTFSERWRDGQAGGIDLMIDFDRDLFDEKTVASIASLLAHVLETVATRTDTPVDDIELPSGGALGGGTPAPDRTYAEIVTATAARFPEFPAVTDGTVTLTYGELDGESDRLARELVGAGTGPGHVVALKLPRSVDLVVAIWAVVKTGAAFLPLDLNQPAHRLDDEMRGAGVTVGIGIGDDSSAPGAGPIRWVRVDSGSREGSPVRIPVPVDAAAYVIYTSGSTGAPKGVVVTHRGLGSLADWGVECYRVTPDSRVLQGYNPAFDAAQLEMLLAFRSGACLVIAPPDVYAGEELQRFLVHTRVTHYLSTPSVLDSLDPEALPGLHVVAVGGEALSATLAEQWASHTAVPDRSMINAYGPTESTVVATASAVNDQVTIGGPIPGTSALVLDHRLRHVPSGGIGELYLAGSGLARGYLGSPALTAERFVADLTGGGRMYRTGDLVYRRADGALDFVARVDQQVKLRGLRIELGEIDAAVRSVVDVDSVATLVLHTDSGSDMLVTYVVARIEIDGEQVRHRLAEVLPSYMVPAVLLRLDAMPVTPSGKLDKRALPQPVLQSAGRFRPPRTPMEHTIAQLVSDVLAAEHVGIDDSFFALGGDSIMSIQLVSRAKELGIRFTPRDVFEQQTVRRLATVASTGPAVDTTTLDEFEGGGVGWMPLMPVAHLILERGARCGRFAQWLALSLPQGIDRDGIVTTLQAVVDRHDMLRARLVRNTENGPGVETRPVGSTDVEGLIHRVALDPEDVRADLTAMAQAELDSALDRLDPDAGVVAQFVWFDFGAHVSGRILAVLHHLAVDGVSWRILVSDLVTAAAQRTRGLPVQLPAVGTSARRWAHALVEAARAPSRRAELRTWTEILDTPDPPLGIRQLDPAVDVMSTVRTLTATVDAATTATLLTELPRRFHSSTEDGLLAALALAVAGFRRARNVDASAMVVQIEGHGREESVAPGADLTRTVGWLTTAYPARLMLGDVDVDEAVAGGPAARRALGIVKEQLRAIPEKGIGFGLLRYLQPETAAILQKYPNPAIAFNYLGRTTTGDLPPEVEQFGWLPTDDLGELDVVTESDMTANAVIDINAIVVDAAEGAQLTARIGYASGAVAEADAREITARWVSALEGLARHARRPSAGGFTPSDFPLVTVTQADIDGWQDRYPSLARIWPLSPLQEGLMLHASAAEDTALDVYTPQTVLELRGAVDAGRLREAAQAVLDRYENLRVAFVQSCEGCPVQIPMDGLCIPWTDVDLSGHDVPARRERLAEVLAHDRMKPFDLAQPPLVRYTLIKLADDSYTLAVTNHHILFDGWSMPLLMRDMLALYAVGDAGVLPPVVSYERFLSWCAECARTTDEEKWRAVLADIEVPTLVAPASTGSSPTSRSVSHRVSLDAESTAALSDTSARLGITMNTAVQAAWAVVLAHALQRTDIVFGAVVSGRPARLDGVESMVGLLINTVPVRVRVESGLSLVDILVDLQRQQSELSEHHHVPLHRLQRIAGHRPLFDTLTVFESYPLDEQGLIAQARNVGGMSVLGATVHDATHYPITLRVHSGARLTVGFEYHREFVDPDTVVALARGFIDVLAAISRDPQSHALGVRALDSIALLCDRPNKSDSNVVDRRTPPEEFRPPGTPMQRLVAGVFVELLETDRLGLGEDFFAAGADSVLALRAAGRISSTLGTTIPVGWILAERTTERLAHRIEQERSAST